MEKFKIALRVTYLAWIVTGLVIISSMLITKDAAAILFLPIPLFVNPYKYFISSKDDGSGNLGKV